MKTTRIVSLFAAALSIVFAASASASPPGKGTRFSASPIKVSGEPKVERKVEHKSMHYVGPRGKGYICRH
jgi:hypothetical protein